VADGPSGISAFEDEKPTPTGNATAVVRYSMQMRILILLAALTATTAAVAAEPAAETAIVLRPARVFDGATMHVGWRVLVKGERIIAAGTDVAAAGARELDLPDATLLPGLIEGHSHLFLHPYNETSWDDQVLHESIALRTVRAVTAARDADGRIHDRARSRHRRRRLRRRRPEAGHR
jgi:imidazolonepropionase-like amidohydrolase